MLQISMQSPYIVVSGWVRNVTDFMVIIVVLINAIFHIWFVGFLPGLEMRNDNAQWHRGLGSQSLHCFGNGQNALGSTQAPHMAVNENNRTPKGALKGKEHEFPILQGTQAWFWGLDG